MKDLISVEDVIKEKLAEITHISVDQIRPERTLVGDLGLDSVDMVDLIAYLDDYFLVPDMPPQELVTVGQVISWYNRAIAALKQTEEEPVTAMHMKCEEIDKNQVGWKQTSKRKGMIAEPPSGVTLPEVFLNCCQERMKQELCVDDSSGSLTYGQAKMRIVLLAEYIQHLPGEYIGILLPASVTAYLTILACQLAGKIPLLINWTMGSQHLESVVSNSKVEVILSSRAFLDRLENVDISSIAQLITHLEEVRKNLSWKDKVKGFIRSKMKTSFLLSLFKNHKFSGDEPAVLLFTSGAESMPKGVPLSHKNILSNQRAALKHAQLSQEDVLIGMLPPFHSFGFTMSGLLPLISGMRAVYFPNPIDGVRVAERIAHWKVTIL